MGRVLTALLLLSGCRETVEGPIVILDGDVHQRGDGGSGDGEAACAEDCLDGVCNPSSGQCVECLVPEHCALPEAFDDECAAPTCENMRCDVEPAVSARDCTPDDHSDETGTCQAGGCVWCTDSTSDTDICQGADAECGAVADGCGSLRLCGDCAGDRTCRDNACVCASTQCGNSCCAVGQVCNGSECCTPTADCAQLDCGGDGCGNSCGACQATTQTCNDGHCVCVDEECLGVCCAAGQMCHALGGGCCTSNCSGRECGLDGCGVSCGSCGSLGTCNTEIGQCICDHTECNGTCCEAGQVCHFATVACCTADTRSDAQVCSAADTECGSAADGCGYLRACADCPGNDYCSTNTCIDHDISSSACAATSSYVWVATSAGTAWSGPGDADASCCGDDGGEWRGNYTYAADDNWNLVRSNTTKQACCATSAECVGGAPATCVDSGVIDADAVTNLCDAGVMYHCGNDSVCHSRTNYPGFICHHDGDSYFWDSKSGNASADIGTIPRQKVAIQDDNYISATNTWSAPSPGHFIDLWACCDDADDCVGEDLTTAGDLGRCITSPALGGQWLCGDAGHWYECRPLSDGATMSGYVCSNSTGSWLWAVP